MNDLASSLRNNNDPKIPFTDFKCNRIKQNDEAITQSNEQTTALKICLVHHESIWFLKLWIMAKLLLDCNSGPNMQVLNSKYLFWVKLYSK